MNWLKSLFSKMCIYIEARSPNAKANNASPILMMSITII
jgi:hypothetical protein